LRPPTQSLVAGISVDGDFAQVAVAVRDVADGRPTLVLDRATTIDDLPRLLEEVNDLLCLQHRNPDVRWVALLPGDDVHHDVVQVPPQLRAFQEARLDASLATTRWGNVDAIEASGYRLGHAFDGDRCLIGVAAGSRLDDVARILPRPSLAASAATGLVALLRIVEPELFDPSAAPFAALLLESTSVAACIIERGQVRLLLQMGLLEYFRDLETPRASSPSAHLDGPLEFELGGSYTVPKVAETTARIGTPFERAAADIESEVYQAASIRVIQDALNLYTEQYGTLCDTPQHLLLTGDAVTRHALRAYLARQLGTQFEVDEVDAAFAVRIDEPGDARRIAASQNSLGGALCALAAGLHPGALTFDLDSERANSPRNDGARTVRAPRISRPTATGIAVCLAMLVVSAVTSLAWTGHVASTIDASLRAERERQLHLKLITDERQQMEARVAHTREVLAELERLRSRQALPPELLIAIREHLPPDTTLDELSLTNGLVRIVGSTDNRQRGAEFALSLEQLHDTFADVTPQVDTVPGSDPRAVLSDAAALDTYTFTISARYVRDPVGPSTVSRVAL